MAGSGGRSSNPDVRSGTPSPTRCGVDYWMPRMKRGMTTARLLSIDARVSAHARSSPDGARTRYPRYDAAHAASIGLNMLKVYRDNEGAFPGSQLDGLP